MWAESDDGVRLWWELEGAGPAVVLLPGRGDSSDLFPRLFSDRLIEGGFAVLRCDPRDTGLSGDGGATYTLSTMADDVVCVLDAAGVFTALRNRGARRIESSATLREPFRATVPLMDWVRHELVVAVRSHLH